LSWSCLHKLEREPPWWFNTTIFCNPVELGYMVILEINFCTF
jgi:hypothetical protein